MKNYIQILIVLILFGQSVSAQITNKPTVQVAPFAWTTISRPDLGFSIKIPGSAKCFDSQNNTGPTHQWVVERDGLRYVVSIGEFHDFAISADAATPSGKQHLLDDLTQGFIDAANKDSSNLQSTRDYQISGYPARECTLTIPAEDQPINMRLITCVNDHGFYSFGVSGQSKFDQTTAAFFASATIK